MTNHITPLQQCKKQILLMAFRQSLIIALGAIEDYLGLERSVVPRRKVR